MGKGRITVAASRERATMTLAPRTEAKLASLSKASGIPRGRIVDLAVDSIEACEECQGTGETDGHRCDACRGGCILPSV